MAQVLHEAFLVGQYVVCGFDKVKPTRLADRHAVVEVWVMAVVYVSAIAGAGVGSINPVEDVVRSQGPLRRFLIRHE